MACWSVLLELKPVTVWHVHILALCQIMSSCHKLFTVFMTASMVVVSLGTIQVLRNADGGGGGGVSDFLKKALRRCKVQCY